MNIGIFVVVSLAFPLLWLSVCTDRRSYDQAIKLREAITEILQSIAEWENDKLGVTKILAFKAYRSIETDFKTEEWPRFHLRDGG